MTKDAAFVALKNRKMSVYLQFHFCVTRLTRPIHKCDAPKSSMGVVKREPPYTSLTHAGPPYPQRCENIASHPSLCEARLPTGPPLFSGAILYCVSIAAAIPLAPPVSRHRAVDDVRTTSARALARRSPTGAFGAPFGARGAGAAGPPQLTSRT